MILDLPLILETRRNHAVEHATLHILADKYKHQNMAGHSNPAGFFLFGNFDIRDIQSAITEAMNRLRAGESGLADRADTPCAVVRGAGLFPEPACRYLAASSRHH